MKTQEEHSAESVQWVELARGISAGSSECETRFAILFRERLDYYLRRRLRAAGLPETDAQDVCQETLITALAALRRGDVRTPGKLGSFVYRIASNKVVDWIKKRKRKGPAIESARVEADSNGSDEDPSTELSEAFSREWKRLSRVQRRILRLKYQSRWPYDRICCELGITEEAARKRAQRAKERLRKAIRNAGA